jgi:hypothetical protein
MLSYHTSALPVIVALVQILSAAAVQAGPDTGPVLHVESAPSGEIELDARGVTIEQTLRAMASEAGFEVMIQEGLPRPPVNMVVSMAPVQQVLRQVLRGRNYALLYDGDESVSRVIVLPPPSKRRAPVPPRRMAVRRR